METNYLFLIGPRACGKSTVAQMLNELLPGWRAMDLDVLFEERSSHRSKLMVHAADYYQGCKEVLLESLALQQVVMALGGGTLINTKHPGGDIDLLVACKKRGHMVLLLPSRSNWRNRRILYQRELERSYHMPRSALMKLKETTYSQYDKRIDFFHGVADLTLYGSDPERLAKQIVKHYNLHDRGSGT